METDPNQTPAGTEGTAAVSPAADANHPDAAKDRQLIMDMIKKYMADGDDTDEATSIAQETYDDYKAMGHSDEEAMKLTESYVKLSKHKAGKKPPAAAADAGAAAGNEEKPKEESAVSEAAKPKEGEKPNDEKHKESAAELEQLRADNLRMKGELARFKESDSTRSLNDHIEGVFAKSGLKREITKNFRESFKGKTPAEFDAQWKTFMEGYNSAKPSSGEAAFNLPFITEKASSFTESAGGGFLDGCLKG